MKRTLLILGILSTSFAQAQQGKVGVNTESPTATLQVKSRTGADATTKNLELTNAQNTNLLTVLDDGKVGIGTATPTAKLEVAGNVKIADGTQGAGKVLTSDANGVARWEPIQQSITNINNFSVSSVVDPNILGYIPSNTAKVGTAPRRVRVGNTYARMVMDISGSAGDPLQHSYALFLADRTITWYDAYYAAKEMGGYLGTFTYDEEWQIGDALLLFCGECETVGAWIGMARFDWYAGSALQPNPEMKWITGEQPKHDYSLRGNHSIRKSNWFAMRQDGHDQNEPNNGYGREGFVHTWPRSKGITKTVNGFTSKHPWNDIAADANNSEQNVRAFIVEFQQ